LSPITSEPTINRHKSIPTKCLDIVAVAEMTAEDTIVGTMIIAVGGTMLEVAVMITEITKAIETRNVDDLAPQDVPVGSFAEVSTGDLYPFMSSPTHCHIC